MRATSIGYSMIYCKKDQFMAFLCALIVTKVSDSHFHNKSQPFLRHLVIENYFSLILDFFSKEININDFKLVLNVRTDHKTSDKTLYNLWTFIKSLYLGFL